ncbi:hypothetical protein V6N11_001354 [Hibiscus sabdariffa]|uniref:Retrovirus-related Pol polyprotein from transposon TNT 1-94-like beta-barrel domain-containing protein n=1 Tax=Hibiscus sabdariffa TaxID=183260 RepID=A0ABR2RZH8_9ROSI
MMMKNPSMLLQLLVKILVICDENLVNLACDQTSWVIDTGISITGMGDVSLVSNNGTKLILKDVRHAPDIRLNLIFAGRLDDEGFLTPSVMGNGS